MNTPQEIETTKLIESMCEDYNILGQPMLPEFDCPNNYSEEQYLRQLCRDGWKDRLQPTGKVNTTEAKNLYTERIKKELDVISDAKHKIKPIAKT